MHNRLTSAVIQAMGTKLVSPVRWNQPSFMTKEYIREVNKYENTKEKKTQDLVNLQGRFHKHRHYLNIFNYSTIVFKFLTKVLNTSRYQSVSQILYRILKYLK